jgi:hypothetical protein
MVRHSMSSQPYGRKVPVCSPRSTLWRFWFQSNERKIQGN